MSHPPPHDATPLAAALAYHRAGYRREAESAYREVLKAEPTNADACHWLGMLLFHTSPTAESVSLVERSVLLAPHVPEFHNNLAGVLGTLGRTPGALRHAAEATRLRPSLAVAWDSLGVALEQAGRPAEAVAAYDRALSLPPPSADAHTHRGNALWKLGRVDESIASHRRALALRPGFAQAWQNLALAVGDRGDVEAMIDCCRRAADLAPGSAAVHSGLLYALLHDPRSTPQSLLGEALRWAGRHAPPGGPGSAPGPHPNDPDPGRRLRVGYVSPDFRRHTIAHLAAPLLAAHDRDGFEVFCYSAVAAPDEVTQRLRGLGDHWRDVARLGDEQADALVRGDRIDVLVDLAGHMAGNRLTLFARRPAPVQVQLGYAGTTGLSALGYRVTDAHCDPPGLTDRYHTEALLRLPACAWPYAPGDEGVPVAPPPVMATGRVTFGCLNKPVKVNDAVTALWSRVLDAVPASRLLVLGGGAGPGNAWLRDRFARHGVAGPRLELVGTRPRRQYLELFGRIDVALDPFPYNGDTTTCDALWMGVPVVTLAGESFASRRGISHLRTVGLPELIASSPAEYVAIAAGLAADPSRLRVLRDSLRDRVLRSPLADARGYAGHLESMYHGAWRRWCDDRRSG